MPQIQDTPYLEQNLPMPFSLEAEQSVLGAVLVDSSCLTTVMEYIKPECFYDKRAGVDLRGGADAGGAREHFCQGLRDKALG